MNEVERYKGEIGLNEATAGWLNHQYQRMERGTRLLMDVALGMGEVLAGLAKVQARTFAEWLQINTDIPRSTAYQYMSLHNYRNQIKAESLNEAYKQIETLQAQKKLSENQKANNRVAEFRKTGVKPEGWRRGTDDKLAKEEEDRDARIKAAFEEKKKRHEQEQRQTEAEREKLNQDIDLLTRHFANEAEAAKKRMEFKERIRLSADGMKDPFQDAILDYLDGLENDNRRIEACYNIIKVCKRIAVELQGVKA